MAKEMKYSVAWLTGTMLANGDNDAKLCYDRIIVSLCMIISAHFGMTRAARKTHAKTSEQMEFRLRAAMGTCTKSYTNTVENPVHGMGQGSSSLSAHWLLISLLIMDCLAGMGTSMQLLDPGNEETLKQWIDGFVDNTLLFVNLQQDKDNIKQLSKTLTEDLGLWEQLLFALNIHEIKAAGASVEITERENNVASAIKLIDCNEAHKTLGTYKTTTGNQDTQIRVLKKKVNKHAYHRGSSGRVLPSFGELPFCRLGLR
jgi:hypothetical protein